jgi:hypothetical protein
MTSPANVAYFDSKCGTAGTASGRERRSRAERAASFTLATERAAGFTFGAVVAHEKIGTS